MSHYIWFWRSSHIYYVRYVIWQYKQRKAFAIHPAITEDSLVQCTPNSSIRECYNVSISAISNLLFNIASKEECDKYLHNQFSCYVLHWSHYTCTTNCHLCSNKEKNKGTQTDKGIVLWCKHRSCCSGWKDISWMKNVTRSVKRGL